jgi:hypothetical protein
MIFNTDAVMAMMPPKSIWDPDMDGHSHDADTACTRTTTVTRRGGGTNPSHLNQVELRVQLWDSYRLARIILGIPIKSFSLKGKTILHAIRIVAEMKLELILLKKELEMTQVSKAAAAVVLSPASSDVSDDDDERANKNKKNQSLQEEELQDQRAKHYQALQLAQSDLVESTHSQLQSIVSIMQQESPPPSASEHDDDEKNNSSSTNSIQLQQEKDIQQMIQDLLHKSQETSLHSQTQFQQLEDQIRTSQRDSLQQRDSQVAQLNKRMQTRQVLHTLELESHKAKHLQQIIDLSGQLDSYKEQVDRQQDELVEWRRNYENLEELAVTPSQAREILLAMESITPESTTEQHEEVNRQVVHVLQRMAMLHSQQQRERRQLKRTVDAAQKREHDSEEHVHHLRLQMEILEEETQVSPEEWREQLAQQRKTYQRQISEILTREEGRLMEMEYLEVHLTELAFMTVEIEDLQKEFKENQEVQTKELEKADSKARQGTMRQTLQALQSQVQDVMKKQKGALGQLAHSTAHAPEDFANLQAKMDQIARAQWLEAQVAQRDEELRQTREQLRLSEQRVQELEAQAGKEMQIRSADTESTAQLSDS